MWWECYTYSNCRNHVKLATPKLDCYDIARYLPYIHDVIHYSFCSMCLRCSLSIWTSRVSSRCIVLIEVLFVDCSNSSVLISDFYIYDFFMDRTSEYLFASLNPKVKSLTYFLLRIMLWYLYLFLFYLEKNRKALCSFFSICLRKWSLEFKASNVRWLTTVYFTGLRNGWWQERMG